MGSPLNLFVGWFFPFVTTELQLASPEEHSSYYQDAGDIVHRNLTYKSVHSKYFTPSAACKGIRYKKHTQNNHSNGHAIGV